MEVTQTYLYGEKVVHVLKSPHVPVIGDFVVFDDMVMYKVIGRMWMLINGIRGVNINLRRI